MKLVTPYNIDVHCKRAAVFLIGLVCYLPAEQSQAQLVIDLSKPVSESVSTITGIHWTGNSIVSGTTTLDSSGNGYAGTLLLNGGTSITSVTGVNVAGASGYGNGIRLATNATASGGSGNPEILTNLPTPNNMGMVATDFTGGAWLNFSSLLSGAQTVNVMNRGVWNNAAQGGWGLNLVKDANGNWQMSFQVGDQTARETHSISLSSSISINSWHHFGFSYDYVADGNDIVTFWMDGTNLGTASFTRNIATGATTGERRFTVGERGSTTYTTVFNGTVDDVFVTTGWYQFQAIPEPGTYALVAIAGGFLVILHRRKAAGAKGC